MVDPPIIANQKGDVLLFESVSEAEAYIEPIDAENDEYSVFDSQGLLLIPTVTENSAKVRLVESSPHDHRPDELVKVLRGFLNSLDENHIGVSEDDLWRMSLTELLSCFKRIEEKGRRESLLPWRRI